MGSVKIHYSGMKDAYKTKSFRCQDSGTRLYDSCLPTRR
jgi:hypothetical protein